MGKPKYMFRPCAGPDGEVVIHMDLLPGPPPTPEKFQRKARTRRLKQQFRDDVITACEFLDSGTLVREDYAAKP